MIPVKKAFFRFILLLPVIVFLAIPQAFARVKTAKLAKKLLYGDSPTRLEAIQAFNKLPADQQYTLVPDFMVALTDDNPEVRKIASRILKAMGVSTDSQIPDAKKDLAPQPTTPPKPAGEGKWSDLEKMRGEEPGTSTPPASPAAGRAEDGRYADLRREIDREKKTQVTLDPAEIRPGPAVSATPLSTVVDSLKDPDPWVRAQAARRLGMVHPPPVDTIPTLIGMLGDKDVESRRAAAAALGSFGPLAREAVPALNNSLADSDNGVSIIAADALKQIQQPQ